MEPVSKSRLAALDRMRAGPASLRRSLGSALVKDGLAEKVISPRFLNHLDGDREGEKLYRITERGKAALRNVRSKT